jgi:hypothetical protein
MYNAALTFARIIVKMQEAGSQVDVIENKQSLLSSLSIPLHSVFIHYIIHHVLNKNSFSLHYSC